MNKIGIDARLYFQTGVGVYLRNLLYYLQKFATKDILFHVYLMEEDMGKVRFENKAFIKKATSSKWHSFSEQTNFLTQLNRDELDLVHFPYFGYPALYKRPFIVTIHDVILLENKTGKASAKNPLAYELKHFVFRNIVLKNQVHNSLKIITPTNTIKKNIISFFGQNIADKITPIYEGVNYELLMAKENKELAKKFDSPFFIYVGNFYPHKNVDSLIMAFSQVGNRQVQLVLAGPNDFFAQRISELIGKLDLNDRVRLYTNPTVEDFVFFYKHALALVHPSLSEGFGLPLVEAMYFNLPIIASNIVVFKEIMNDQYLEFDPHDVGDIKDKLKDFLKEKKEFDYANLIKKYSFEEMTKKTLDVYNKAIA